MSEEERKRQYEKYNHFAEAEGMLKKLKETRLDGVPDRIEFAEVFPGSMDDTVVLISLQDREGKELWNSPQMFRWEVEYGDCAEFYYFVEELVKMYPVRFIDGRLLPDCSEHWHREWKDFIGQFDWKEELRCWQVRRPPASDLTGSQETG